MQNITLFLLEKKKKNTNQVVLIGRILIPEFDACKYQTRFRYWLLFTSAIELNSNAL